MMMNILMLFAGLLTGLPVGWLIFEVVKGNKTVPKDEYNALLAQFNDADTQRRVLEDRLATMQRENLRLDQKCDVQETEISRLNQRLSDTNAACRAMEEKLSTQKNELETMRKTMLLEFERIAGRIMEEKSGKFTELNRNQIEAILKPLGERIDSFKKKVEETYDRESRQRFSLEERVKELVEQTNRVSAEANNLATALKGQSKTQGNWGEMILESILQQSGLVKDREYFLQQTGHADGRTLRPDVLVKLPDNRIIIIDSKVSLTAYDRYAATDTADAQAPHLKEHIRSIRTHVDELSAKSYDSLPHSLDFTMMFIPVEPAYLVAIQSDPTLWSDAYRQRILLISPTNLIACLKLMADLWKREMQSRNAREIVRRGELMYEKMVAFLTTFEEVGRSIGRTQQAYDTATMQLTSGYGNLVGQAVKLKNLGLKSSKELPSALLPDADDEIQDSEEMNE
jgi:DNA recombination protein RmuC